VKPAWSYSAIGLFEQCPKKYYHIKVVKDTVEPQSEAILYGELVHTAAENFIKDGTPIPPQFKEFAEPLQLLNDMPGEKHCEFRMGLTELGEPCGFFDPKVWLRGIADLIIVDGEEAKIIDYKTGKSSKYADTKQLDLMALCTFAHFPQVQTIKAGLLFLVCEDFIKRKYVRGDVIGIMREWTERYQWLVKTYQEGVWNAKPNFTCSQYCPVVSCVHNGKHV
jgi:hypothetical protein